MTPQKAEAFALFSQGATIEQVAAKTGRSPSTCWEYLAKFVESKKPASIAPWVPDETCHTVAEAYRKMGWGRLPALFEALGGTVPFNILRVVVAHVRGVAARAKDAHEP